MAQTEATYQTKTWIQCRWIRHNEHGVGPAYSDSGSRHACVDAAKAILKPGMELQHMGCVNPILGVSFGLSLVLANKLTGAQS